jgi:hypothetical protein
MTRINNNNVIQLVGDDRLVFVDDTHGTEIVIPLADADKIISTIRYFQDCVSHPEDQPPIEVHVLDSVEDAMAMLFPPKPAVDPDAELGI